MSDPRTALSAEEMLSKQQLESFSVEIRGGRPRAAGSHPVPIPWFRTQHRASVQEMRWTKLHKCFAVFLLKSLD